VRIGLDVGGTKIEAIALDEGGRELVRRRVATPREDYAKTLEAMAELVTGIERELGRRGSVGIGIPGAISPATGLVKNANSTWLIGQRLSGDLERLLERPLRFANDANCFALSEATDGAGRGARTVFGVIIGTGTGGGVVVDGQVLTGKNAVAGEWGHSPLPWPSPEEWPGPACYCGKTGCIETFLSGPGLARDYASRTGRELASNEIAFRAADDAEAAAALERYADRMARGLATIINLLDPDVIVLGGGMSQLEHLYDRVPRLWGRYVFSDRVDTHLRPPVHGDSSGVRGAAWLWPPAQRDRASSSSA
jgi:fructokinase